MSFAAESSRSNPPLLQQADDAPAEVELEYVAKVVARLRATFAGGRTRELRWRLAQLAGVEKLLREHESDIAEALAADLGRSPHEAWFGDLVHTKIEARFARKHLSRWMRRRGARIPLTMRPGHAFYQYEPLGVVLVISSWNYPVYLTLGPLVSVLAAGNCAVVKPSECAAATSALLARLIPKYLDPEAVVVLQGDGATAQALLGEGLDHAFFTGSPAIGTRVLETAARHLTPVTLELGGKSPVIVTNDADVPVAARRIAWAKLLNSGQSRIAPDYVLVEERVRDDLVDEIIVMMRAFRSGEHSGLRVVNEDQFDRIAALIDAPSGRVALGGHTDRSTLTMDPVVLVDPDPDSPVMTEEIFGPILPVLTVQSLTEAIKFVNNRPKPLAAYVFTSLRESGNRVMVEVNAGATVVNQVNLHSLIPRLPFGGVGHSGMGSIHGEWGFQTFSHRKAVLAKPAKPDPMLMYPAYSERSKKLARRLLR